jgi:threonine/homoserine/homoserine lactone efflux protein
MTTYYFIELGITYLLAIMMPGPSIALIIKNAMLYSRLASVKICFGIMAGIALQSGAVLVGLAFVDNDSNFLKIIKILCSLLLIYLGLKILLTKKAKILESDLTLQNTINIKQWGHFFEGFLVEFLNPLAFTFFVSIMTIIISPQEFWGTKIAYWIEIIVLGSIWFLTVAFILSSERITFYTRRFNKILEIIAGSIFIVFGGRMFIY